MELLAMLGAPGLLPTLLPLAADVPWAMQSIASLLAPSLPLHGFEVNHRQLRKKKEKGKCAAHLSPILLLLKIEAASKPGALGFRGGAARCQPWRLLEASQTTSRGEGI